MDEFDQLVEQQDQELALTGEVSPFTRLQLEALAEGRPVPHVWNTPAIQQATARLLQGMRLPRVQGLGDDDDDYWPDD